MRQRQTKYWYKIGRQVFNFEDVVHIEIAPDGAYLISVRGKSGDIILEDATQKQEFRQYFKQYCDDMGDEIIGL